MTAARDGFKARAQELDELGKASVEACKALESQVEQLQDSNQNLGRDVTHLDNDVDHLTSEV